MSLINNVLNQCKPFLYMVAMLFGIIAAWGALSDLLPVLKQVWVPRLPYQPSAIVGAALAIIAGNR